MVIGDFKDEHNHRRRYSALGYRTPAEYAARCSHTHDPVVACEINWILTQQQPGSKSGWTHYRGHANVPRPHLRGLVGEELGFDVRRVGGLTAPFPALAGVTGDAVHRRRGAQVGAGVELTGSLTVRERLQRVTQEKSSPASRASSISRTRVPVRG